MKLTSFGHSCFAVETAGQTLLFDPFITPNDLARSIKLEDIRADYILVSHGHFDHIADAVQLAGLTGATVISNFEISSWLGKKGVGKNHPLNAGGSFDFGPFRAKGTNAIHSSMLPDGSNGGSPIGFVIESKDGAFYYAGDTALTMDMQLVGEEFDLRFAVLPIGDNFTMGAKDAVRAARFVKTKTVVGCHYDTFPPIKIDHAAARRTFSDAGMTLHLVEIGKSADL